MKKNLSILTLSLITLFGAFFIPNYSYAQIDSIDLREEERLQKWETTKEINLVDVTTNKEKIIDYIDINPNETLVAYTYEQTESEIIYNNDSYSNTEKIGNDYIFYTYKRFQKIDDKNFIIENKIVNKTEFDKLNIEIISDEKPISLINQCRADVFDISLDGTISKTVCNAGWESCHDATDGGSTITSMIDADVYQTTAPRTDIQRGILHFDISSIPSGYSATAGYLNIWTQNGGGNQDNDGMDYVALTESTITNVTLQTSDYDSFNDDELSEQLDLTGLNYTRTEYQIDLNEAGLAYINTDSAKFMIREGHDIQDTPPDNGMENYITFQTSASHDDEPPTLVLTLKADEPEASTTATTTPFVFGATSTSLTIITAWTQDGITYYYVPFLFWLLITIISLYIFNRILLEFLIRWRR